MHEGRTDGRRERIALATAALYRVTALLPSTEPLRTILREYANRVFVEDIQRARAGSGGGDWDEAAIETLCGFLAVARALPGVRPENFSVLEREYRAFAAARTPDARGGADNAGQGGYPALRNRNRARAENAPVVVKKARLSTSSSPQPILSSLDGVQAAGERQRAILERLAKTPQAKASDFYVMLKGVSPKTIQRDLQDLVAQNVIKREGDRRWTVYSRPDVR